ncbi:uncharacterized protein LOC101744995 [Bombyx mori]|uniref:CRAL-TRIO domain-containing protein n=1 Tax=Bombyx mori TaxID=7091 RepID=A0A8R2M3A4_BOMMO|nr:uncharacterized protein LOC101744995 [Bombyx mori]
MERCLINVSTETKRNVRKLFDLDEPGRLEDAVQILDEWIKKQTHFLKTDYERAYLERTIIFCKGSIEKAKQQIDRLCTYKTMVPVFFECTNMMEMKSVFEICTVAVLPELTPDHYRVLLVKINNTDFDAKKFMTFYKCCIMIAEYLKRHDYCTGYIMVNDYRNINVTDMLTKIDFVNIPQFLSIIIQGYGCSVKGIHFLTPSKLIENFVNIFKQFVSEKLSGRIHALKTLENLYDYIPKDILPVEYEGGEKSVELLNDDLMKVFTTTETMNYLEMMKNACTDESKRQKDIFNEQYMGLPGSFRALTVD